MAVLSGGAHLVPREDWGGHLGFHGSAKWWGSLGALRGLRWSFGLSISN